MGLYTKGVLSFSSEMRLKKAFQSTAGSGRSRTGTSKLEWGNGDDEQTSAMRTALMFISQKGLDSVGKSLHESAEGLHLLHGERCLIDQI
jgi:hypothetical protein